MSNSEWLAGLQVGDAVMVEDRSPYITRLDVRTIARITKTQIVLDDGTKYSRAWGRKIGERDAFGSDTISPVDDGRILKHKKEVARKHAVVRMREYPWNGLTLTQLQQVEALLKSLEVEESDARATPQERGR